MQILFVLSVSPECFSVSPRAELWFLLALALSLTLQRWPTVCLAQTKCSLSLSHALHVFTTDLKFNTSHHWAILIPAEALSCQILQRCCPEQLLGFNGIYFCWHDFLTREVITGQFKKSSDWMDSGTSPLERKRLVPYRKQKNTSCGLSRNQWLLKFC